MGAHIEVVETVDGRWMVLANGVQQGAPIDHAMGCGTATYASRDEAERAAAGLRLTEARA